jgi:putative ABC transport system ATP-binding protein
MHDAQQDRGISLVEVSKGYSSESGLVQVLSHLSLLVREGDFVALMGPSGSGKSTLLNLLGGLSLPDSGSVRVRGQEIGGLSESGRAEWRAANIGFVFQSLNLIPVLRAEENVELPLLAIGVSGAQRHRSARAALSLTGMSDRARHFPRQLSGGQQQRVAIARAIVADPALVLCDEPTGNLDAASSESILDLLVEMNERLGKTIVLVTHDRRAALRAKRVLNLDKGALSVVAAAA